jgi:putative ABC transport system permease protein
VTRMAIRGLFARKLRSALTGFAVVIGVAFVAGTFVFTDTINESFKDLFERVSKGVDVNVTAKEVVEGDFGGRIQPLPEGTLEQVESADGVEAAEGRFEIQVAMFDADRERIGGNGPPSIAFSANEERFDPLTYVDGGPAREPGQVALDEATADREGFEVGDSILVGGREPAREYEIVGITNIGDQRSIGIQTLSMPLEEVQRIAQQPGAITEVVAAAEGGTSPEELKASIVSALGDTAEVRTGEEQADESAADINDSLGFIKIALLVFAGIAVLVGSFLIFNTFAVTVAQRSREFALLRTIGASRRQVLNAVLAETLLIGFFASVLGILAGVALAPALRSLLASFGIDLPSTGTVIGARTVIVGLVVGMVTTLVSGLVPARRATHIEPVEAMREADTPGAHPVSRKRLIAAGAVLGLGLAVLLLGLFGGAGGSAAASLLGLGVVVMMLGVAVLAPVLVRPLARFIGAPLVRWSRMTGRLARENTERQPQRTAITASALMIGLALVVFTTIFAAGLSGSFDKVIDEQLSRSSLIVTHDDGFSPVPTGVAEELARTDGVTTVSPLRWDQANVEGIGDSIPASGVDPATVTQLFEPEIEEGSREGLGALRDDQAFASDSWAESNDLAVGDRFEVTTPPGNRVGYELVGTYDNQVGMLGEFLVTNGSMTKDWNQPDDAFILVGGEGSPETLARAAEDSLQGFPVAKAQTLEEYKDDVSGQVNQLLGLVYALLLLSVIVAVLGIVNTLALSVFERTRELGLLRAVGMTKWQTRRMVAGESVITALIGAVLGLVLGIVFALVISRPLADEGFVLTFPIGTLIVVTILAGIAGMLAAIPPALRASRVDVLRAVTTE